MLLLRGPQTVGELRARTERMAPFDGLDGMEHELELLAEREEPLAESVARRPGQKEGRWATTLVAPEPDAGSTDRSPHDGGAAEPPFADAAKGDDDSATGGPTRGPTRGLRCRHRPIWSSCAGGRRPACRRERPAVRSRSPAQRARGAARQPRRVSDSERGDVGAGDPAVDEERRRGDERRVVDWPRTPPRPRSPTPRRSGPSGCARAAGPPARGPWRRAPGAAAC